MMSDHPNQSKIHWNILVGRCLAMLIVALNVAIPLLAHSCNFYIIDSQVIVLGGLIWILCLDNSHAQLLGFRTHPTHGWNYWFRMGICFGAAIGLLMAALIGLAWLLGIHIAIPSAPPSVQMLLFFCFHAPVEEEIVYRSLLVFAILPTCGELGTILISGLIFAAIHILNGNPGPDNQVAGFMLTWAFIKSRTILVPMALHSAGNFIAFTSLMAGWYVSQ